MSSPIQFYRTFQSLMRGHGIRHALTSGMACVEYGIQQNTKDTDWIIHPDDLGKLLSMLRECERGITGTPWHITYRALFGAPFLETYHRGGWTTHIAIHDSPDSPEHHLVFFGQPPRVQLEDVFKDATDGLASRSVIAQMKKTDRAKDWPFVNGPAIQSCTSGDFRGLLHLREPELLQKQWRELGKSARLPLEMIRPLLSQIDKSDEDGLERLLVIERTIWESVNRERYRIYQHEWKDFYRRWQKQAVGKWPTKDSFENQHRMLCDAVARFELPLSPMTSKTTREEIYQKGIARAINLTAASHDELEQVIMPIEHLLP